MSVRLKQNRFAFVLAICLCCTLTWLTGCGPGENRRVVSGAVSWDGKSLDKGVITFYPLGDGDTVGCEVINGKYALDTTNGAKPGKYRVEIIAFRPTGRSEFDVDQNKKVSVDEQYLPTQYNAKSTLEVEVADGKANTFDFTLTPGN